MKTPLDPVLEALSDQNIIVGRARNTYLSLEAEKRHFESTLVQAADGKSQAEKLVNAQAKPEWLTFQKRLARAESIYEFEKFKLEILKMEYQSSYLELKEGGSLVRKGAG